MLVKCVELFEFSELSEVAKERAIQDNRDFNVDWDDWHKFILDDWQDVALPKLGFENAEISYTGFWSQGDGASFCARVNIDRWLTVNKQRGHYRRLLKYLDWISIKVDRNGHYYHEYTMGTDLDLYEEVPDKVYMLAQELEDAILEDARDLARQIYRELRKEYEFQTSDEAVAEGLIANEYLFTEDGHIEPRVKWLEEVCAE